MECLKRKLKIVPKEKIPQQTSKKVIKVVKVPTITETEKFILDTVKGQDEQVRQIVNAEYKSINYKIKSNVLIVGKSGTGKTEILRQLAKKTGKVCITTDANDYTAEVLENILTSSKKSKFKMYVNCLKKDGITTKYTKKNISAFAQKAKVEGKETGARELANVTNYVFDKIMYQVMSKPKGTYKELILQEGIEDDNTKYILK